MGNHCIDCEFCGQDQRLVGTGCCPEYIAQQDKKRADAKARYEAEKAYLARFGLNVYDLQGLYFGKVDARDVVVLLKKFEGKILKPNRRKKKPEPDHYE